MLDLVAEADGEPATNPTAGIFVACCASAGGQSAKSMAQSGRIEIFLFMFFFALFTLQPSFDPRPKPETRNLTPEKPLSISLSTPVRVFRRMRGGLLCCLPSLQPARIDRTRGGILHPTTIRLLS